MIGAYAIGGGVATILNSREFSTKDLDVFTTLPKKSGLVDLGPIWKFLQESVGAILDGQFIVVDGIPMEFIDPRPGSIEEEALRNPEIHTVYGMAVPVFRPEYLFAIYLNIHRPGDAGKMEYLWEYGKLDRGLLHSIVQKYGLEKQWQAFLKTIT